MTAATFSFGEWHRADLPPANGSMSHSQGDRFMFRKWLMATAAVLFIGGGILYAAHYQWRAIEPQPLTAQANQGAAAAKQEYDPVTAAMDRIRQSNKQGSPQVP